MRLKRTWLPFVPLALLACFFKLAPRFFPGVMGLSTLALEYCYLGCVLLVFIVTLVLALPDKKTAAYYLPHRNYPAGIIGLILSLFLATEGGYAVIRMVGSGRIVVMELLGAILSLLSAVVFIILGLNHSFRYKEGKSFSLIHVIPAVMFGVRMILTFIGFTTISVREADVSALICNMLGAMFFFNYAVVLSLTKSKNALKSCFIYGLPAIAAMLPYGIYQLITGFDAAQVFGSFPAIEMILFGLYILAILIEITIFVRDKDSVSFVSEDEVIRDIADRTVDGFIANYVGEDENDRKEDDSYVISRDTEGFLYQGTARPEEELEVNDDTNNDVDSYLTEVSEEKEDDRPKDYESRLDDIDNLILDISKKSD